MDKTGEDLNGLHLGKFEKSAHLFSNLRYVSETCIKMSFIQLENYSQLLCGHDFANERLLVCQFDVYSS